MAKLCQVLLVVISLILCSRSHQLQFSLDDLSCSNADTLNIKCFNDSNDMRGGGITLTADSRQDPNLQASAGYVFYQTKIPMKDPATGQAASFSTMFTFSITRVNASNPVSGDGLAFVMLANDEQRGSAGGTLGVYNRTDYTYLPGTEVTKTFCVEYDTFLNPGLDPSANHVGVDLENITSKITQEASVVGITLADGIPVTSWIDYNFSSKNLEVRISNNSNSRPLDPLIKYSLDMSLVVDQFMWAGFAASTGGQLEYHDLFNWSFSSFGLPPLSSDARHNTALIVGLSVGLSFVLLLCGLGFCIWSIMTRRSEKCDTHEDFQYENSVVDMPFKFTYRQLSVATNGFSEKSKLGQGGSSSVYRGVIPSTGTHVAVKRVTSNSKQGEKDFIAEISAISRLRHRNLVKLLGWCSDRGNFLLVYELMPNGSLDKLLYGDGEVLSWVQRMDIVKGIAKALYYLHEGYAQQVIHRDVKSSNVMLDAGFVARLGDFGLARLIEHSKNLETTQLAGTVGYIAPEAVLTWKSTDKTDVYAFGVLVLEIATARRPIIVDSRPKEMVLVDWVWHCYGEGDILKVADRRLEGDFPVEEMKHVLLVGLLCSHPDPDSRPSMRVVDLILGGHVPLPPVPPSKPMPVFASPPGLVKSMMNGMNLNSGSSGTLFTSSSSANSNRSINLISL